MQLRTLLDLADLDGVIKTCATRDRILPALARDIGWGDDDSTVA